VVSGRRPADEAEADHEGGEHRHEELSH
jgi:hypothetical protein